MKSMLQGFFDGETRKIRCVSENGRIPLQYVCYEMFLWHTSLCSLEVYILGKKQRTSDVESSVPLYPTLIWWNLCGKHQPDS